MDGIENKFNNNLLVLRLNIQESVGRELAHAYGFEYTPTYIFFDAKGRELWRSIGEIDPQKIADSMK